MGQPWALARPHGWQSPFPGLGPSLDTSYEVGLELALLSGKNLPSFLSATQKANREQRLLCCPQSLSSHASPPVCCAQPDI